ncbi:hypothetical protein [Aureispira anguillae]|uniref:Uncharacterized protein n=1 Tax=Aureispira anguillae TaxID=2864201 RepID=A0A916DS91_9BACT|nr:hypothetical protein [Aureispira anguillae]BDS10661.1 hypothetical protein AsAng_0013700 [Aureispira anguillae]
MKLIFLLSCWLLIQPTIAQNFKQDFLEVYNHHKNRDYYTQDVIVSSFEKREDTKPINQEKGKIVKGDQGYYSKFGGQETIVDGKHFLFINHADYRVVYYHDVEIDIDQLTQVYQQGLDSVNKERIHYMSRNGKYKTYQIHSPNEMIKTIEVKLNMEEKLVEQITYYYQGMNAYESTLYKTVINYKIISTKPPSKDWFNWQEYITVKGKKASLNTKYRQFNLTQREEKKINWN